VKGKEFKADIGVLVCPVRKSIKWKEEQVLNFVGWLSQQDWLERREKVDVKYGLQWVVERENLRPIEELVPDAA
jgi:hypothetical protein